MRVRFSGLGGQGVVVSGVIYGHAAMFEGFNVVQSQSYGSTTRGGVTTSDVVFARDEIHELEVVEFDLLVALCQEAYDRFHPLLRPGGVLLTDRSLVDVAAATQAGRVVEIEAVEAAREQLGRQILANIVTLGALYEAFPEVGEAAVVRAIKAHVPAGTTQINLRAFELGRELTRSAGNPSVPSSS